MPNTTGIPPSNVTRTLVCIDRYENCEIYGRLINPFEKAPRDFNGVLDMAGQMEALFDRLAFPQASFRYRSFSEDKKPQSYRPGEVRRYMDEIIFENERGEKATFIIQVQFRQNATWQGTIRWADKKKVQRFRSTLEMIKLMDDALGGLGSEVDPSWQDED